MAGSASRVGTSGKRTWIGVYHFEGRPREGEVTVPIPEMTLADARVAHATAKKKIKLGTDPGAELIAGKEAEREAETVADLAAEYLSDTPGRESAAPPRTSAL